MTCTPPERTKPPPPRRHVTGPPLPAYLPMRFVRWEQYDDIWPNEAGSPFPSDNSEYPHPSPGWGSLRDEQFYYWLLSKNVEPKWFHQTSCRKVKQELLDEFSLQWLEEGDCPVPKNRLWIKNYGGHRDMFYNSNAVNRPYEYIKMFCNRFIDWLNNLTGATKPKRKAKQPSEQMATLGELFDGYESAYTHLTNATLGNEKGQVRCGDEVHCYVRSQDGLDNNGGAQYRKAFPVYCGDSDIDLYEAGTPVYVEYVDETGLSIVDRERGTPHTMGGGR